MKLTELEPRWIGIGRGFEFTSKFGVTFLCPCCRKQRVGILFDPILDPDNDAWKAEWAWPGGKKWQRTGDTFETLSLSPSIDLSAHGHWHGFITNGEIR